VKVITKKILEEEPPSAGECKLPWLVDAFLYPTSDYGMERDSISEGLNTLAQADAFGDPVQTLIR